jgi:hypothetical protein
MEAKVRGRALFAVGILSFSILSAQSPVPQQSSPPDDTKNPLNPDPNSPKDVESGTLPIVVYLSGDSKPIPLESESITIQNRTDAGKDQAFITIPNQRSSFRVTANPPVFIVKGQNGFVEDISHPVIISRLKTSGNIRQYRVKDMFINDIDTRHRSAGHDTAEVDPLKALDPGEYMVTAQPIQDLRDGDTVFLFGVD